MGRRFLGILGCVLLLATCKSRSKEGTVATTAPTNGKAETAAVERPPTRTAPLGLGEKAWNFSALAHNGQRVRLAEFLDKPVLVYFCAQSAAAPCHELASDLKRNWLELNASLSMVFAVTADDVVVQREYGAEHEIPFLLLADGSGELRRAFGVPEGGIMSYLLDRDASARRVFSPPTLHHATEVRQALQELGLLLPAYPL
jgi:peroxiredoxin